MLDAAKLGNRIKRARCAKHMTAEAFAEKTDLSVSFLREIERGSKKPSLAKFIEIANALEMSSDDLLKDSIHVSNPLILQGLAKELEGLSANQLSLIEKVVLTMRDEFQNKA